jgi:Ca-activated chloride channel family protein
LANLRRTLATKGESWHLPGLQRAIVLLSDGEDTSSLVSFDEVLDAASRSDTVIYPIGLGNAGTDVSARRTFEDAQFVLRRLAQQAGGRAFFPQVAKDLAGVYRESRDELSSQYLLAYESSSQRNGQWRRVNVRVNRPNARFARGRGMSRQADSRSMTRFTFLSLVVAIIGLGTLPVSGQDPAPPVFRSETNLVVLHVNVFDDDGHPVPKLARENFLVFENDHLQDIRFFSTEDVPVTAGLVIDNSSSTIAQRPLMVASGMAFANSSHPDDELFVVSFTEHVRFGLPEGVPFTSSRDLVQAALNDFRPGGRTALYDAVISTLDHIQSANHQKRIVIVVSDGDDTASRAGKEEMFARAAASGAVIFTVGMIDPATGISGNRGVLRTLARLGGGVAHFPDTEREVVESFEEIAAAVRQGYSIGYVPTPSALETRFRRVRVAVRVPGRRGLSVRYRNGYMASKVSTPE